MDTLIIGIAGGTGSGKSTFTNRLKGEFKEKVTVIYHDNYYKSRKDISEKNRKKINFDHPNSLETELLIKHLKKLKNGLVVECPLYDYSVHDRREETKKIYPANVIIVEGILVLQNENLRDLFDIKVYVEADADERILRRVLRDLKERGREIEEIVEQYLTTVKPMHYLFVEPTKLSADILINSGLNDVAFDIVKTKIAEFIAIKNNCYKDK